jgi:phosphocarrier protein HPr
MLNKDFVITDKLGIHARPATILVSAANKFSSTITISHKEKTINLKSILGVMSLGLGLDAAFQLQADGSDEEEALQELEQILLKEKLAKPSVQEVK